MAWAEAVVWIEGAAAFVSGVVLLVGALRKYVVKPIVKRVEAFDEVLHEVKSNSGLSLRDSVDRIEARVLVIWQSHSTAMYECDVNGRCVFVNDSLCELFGLSPSHMYESGWLEALHHDDRISTFRHWMECIDNGIPYSATYRLVHPQSGKETQVFTKAEPMRSGTGKIVGYYGTVSQVALVEDKKT